MSYGQLGNRPAGRYEVRRDDRTGRDIRFGWYVFDAKTDTIVRFFTSQRSALDFARRLTDNPL